MASKHSFVAYIDEAGDEGFKFPKKFGDPGSTHWFVLSAALFVAETEPEQVKCVDRARAALKRDPNKPLHFRELKHEQKVAYCREVARASFLAASVAVFKPECDTPRFRRKGWLYHFAGKLLLERLSWACRERINDTSRPLLGDGTVDLVFSSRPTFSRETFRGYLNLIKERESGVDWDIIDTDSVETFPHAHLRGLQIADLVASSVFFSLQPHHLGHTEPRYVREFRKRLYSSGNRILNNGFKLFPSQAVERVQRFGSEELRELLGLE